jgi:homoserine O-acetyltransferase/O-succinyltransferase
MNKDSVGYTEIKHYVFAQKPNELLLDSGQRLGPITITYETYGKLNKDKTNAILINHALSGNAHAAGFYEGDEKPGWWDSMIGPGKAFDTKKYFIICSNVIGGCGGSTGPSSIGPNTNKAYGLNFPIITIADMVEVQRHLIDYLGIDKLHSVAGGSMGGMQVLQWVAAYPGRVKSVIPIATALKHSPQQIAFSEVGRQAVMADSNWRNGNYYEDKKPPEKGLAVARMIGHITYMSDKSMEEKFSRKLKKKDLTFLFTADFEVEGYLHHRSDNFVKRFDANSYLYITKAMDYFDLSGDKFLPKKHEINTKFLVIAFRSDWLYPAHQMKEIVRQLKIRHIDAVYCEIESTCGHDAFLIEVKEQTKLIKHFLNKV